MRKLLLLFVGLFAVVMADAQNPATVFTIPQKHITLPCGTNCTNISVQVPHIRQSTTYTITTPVYAPYAYTSPAGTELVDVYGDDEFSTRIPFPFAFFFCFYGTTYSSLSVGSNSVLSFDPTLEQGDRNEYRIRGPLPNTELESAAIFGPMHDIDPVDAYNPAPTERKIEWRVEGTAPKRRFIASYNSVAYYLADCAQYKATHQMVIYENTGIIEVYIKDKPYCLAWNDGLSILGVQNADKTQSVAAPGKNATVWGTEAMDSCYRFIPYGGAPMFRRAELRRNNVVLATNTTDTSTASPGVLNLNFPNVCPTADSTAYEIKVYYGSCSNPALEVSFSDTVFIKKSVLAATVAKTDATCDVNGSITVTATGATGALQYSSNGGTSYQAGNTFTNLLPGTYTIMVRDAGTCPVTQTVTINLIGSVTVNAGLDTTICKGATFTRTPVSTGTTFTWTSTGGGGSTAPAVNSSITVSPQVSTTYTITAVRGLCSATDDFKVDVTAGAVANAGADGIILAGQNYQINATATGGTYTWTPPAGLSATNTLSPKASPAQTTTYTLQVTTPQGCTATDDILITVVPYCIKPMTAFTPNGDGINDYWLITNGNCLTSAKAQIFNRYGAIVFESKDYKNDWQGTYKGKPLPDGTYYFVISFVLINGKTEYLKGNVTILR
ncbi:MAG: gliding motility-associated C-terminal domain-containing protein [Chitinophagaceae bacterium]